MHAIIPIIPKYGYYKDLCRLFSEASKRNYATLQDVICEAYIKALHKEKEGKHL